MKGLFLAIVVLLFSVVHAQESPERNKLSKIDSLRIALNKPVADTNSVNDMIRLVREFIKTGQFDSCKKYADNALQLAIKIGFLRGQAGCYNNMGVVNHYTANYDEALVYYRFSARLRQALGDSKAVASVHNNIAKIYFNRGNYPMSLEYVLKALAFFEKSDDIRTTATLYNDLGNIYLNKPQKAVEYYKKSLALHEKAAYKQGIANECNNLGVILVMQKDYEGALPYFQKAMELKMEIGDLKGAANTLDNIGGIYLTEKKFAQALDCHQRSLAINVQMGEKYTIGPPMTSIANVYMEMGKLKEALDYGLKSLQMAKEVGSFEHLQDAEKSVSLIYEKMGNTPEAFSHYKKYISARDSLFNEDKTKKTVEAEMNFEFEKQKAVQQAEQEKKDAIHASQIARKELERNFLIGGILLVLGFSFLLYKNYKQKQKANELLASQKKEIELQKTLVEVKNNEVTDSIKYAKRIQQSLFPQERYIERALQRLKGYF